MFLVSIFCNRDWSLFLFKFLCFTVSVEDQSSVVMPYYADASFVAVSEVFSIIIG